MESVIILESDLQRLFLRDNWVSVIANKKNLVVDIDYMLMRDAVDCTANPRLETINLIELRDSIGRGIYLKVKITHLVHIEYSGETGSFCVNFTEQRISSCILAAHPSFSDPIRPEFISVRLKKGCQPLSEYLKKDKLENRVNFDAINESIQWIFSQQLHLKNKPAFKMEKIA